MKSPLLDLFLELKSQQFPLGVGEYVLALKALAKGFGTRSREDLIFMCHTIWAKTTEEQMQVRKALDLLLPVRLSLEQLEKLQQEASELLEQAEAQGDPTTDLTDMLRNKPLPSRGLAPRSEGPTPRLAPEALPAPAFGSGGVRVTTLAEQTSLVFDSSSSTLRFDLVGNLPVTRRQMKQTWRSYRRMRRMGPASELDLQATIGQILRNGILVELILVPRRRNLARLLLIVDVSSSMVPFKRITEALVDSVQHGDLGTVSVLFFRNTPGDVLFRDSRLNVPFPVCEALKSFRKSGVLIVSDAGAARGTYYEARAALTTSFLQSLKNFTPNIAWLNPTPESRWKGTTAGEICEKSAVPMFTLDHAGLIETVEVLRGKGH